MAKKWFDKTQQNEFRNLIEGLASNENLLNDKTARYKAYINLENLYYRNGDIFRHFYSDIFAIIKNISQNKNADINILGENIAFLTENYRPKNNDDDGNLIDISSNLIKLYDHISLDIARLSFINEQNDKLVKEERLKKHELLLFENDNSIKKLQDSIEKTKKTLQMQQREYIAILGIFAAVVIAFVGSFAFSTSVLENVNASNFQYTLTGATLIGTVFVNGLLGLFLFIGKIVDISMGYIKWRRMWLAINAIIVITGIGAILLLKYV